MKVIYFCTSSSLIFSPCFTYSHNILSYKFVFLNHAKDTLVYDINFSEQTFEIDCKQQTRKSLLSRLTTRKQHRTKWQISFTFNDFDDSFHPFIISRFRYASILDSESLYNLNIILLLIRIFFHQLNSPHRIIPLK